MTPEKHFVTKRILQRTAITFEVPLSGDSVEDEKRAEQLLFFIHERGFKGAQVEELEQVELDGVPHLMYRAPEAKSTLGYDMKRDGFHVQQFVEDYIR